ncbi:MAG: 30S ribosomal protein S9 [Sphingobacteriales bacterium]|jgi:small subunit ribosomal protein S9|nr:30S ribosomal protein S9 [Sphingobacteriales bacterium]MBP6323572.1 30S ribosomal protein S9 [Chitinophagales bacterium]MCC6583585.1 30S ribosomal protein S9 [Chitinophagales bacterium]HNY54616.1 30S ribosomal protein S9 [Chitinophagales bacterium]HOY40671.1 30S ribosomal protein S9 [Chitinophagales bacterium]
MAKETINGLGRRKTAVARVYLKSGKGTFIVNGKDIKEYISLKQLVDRAIKPLNVTESIDKFDITVNVKGGGIKGQAEAISLGIARALVKNDETVKPALKAENLMTRDSRMVERKKFGKKKARKSFQFSKR